jgi:hypothetical protein
MHNATQSNTTITTHCTTGTELLLSRTDESSVTWRTSFKLQQCCHYFVSNPCIKCTDKQTNSNLSLIITLANAGVDFTLLFEKFDLVVGFCTMPDLEQEMTWSTGSDWKPTMVEEIKTFIAMHVMMGIHMLPDLRHYWSSDNLFGVSTVANQETN